MLMDLTGTRLGSYKLTGLLGQGGMGTVYLARAGLSGQEVAIKVIYGEDNTTDTKDLTRRFTREGELLQGLTHPNLVQVIETGQKGNLLYLVMELVRGQTLSDILRAEKRLSSVQVVYIARQVAQALEYAYCTRGIIHRDIKPENIMLRMEDNRVKVMDFGLAKSLRSLSVLTTTSNFLGSPYYIAPEQINGIGTDQRCDIYSLGVVMYKMATGRLPFQTEDMMGYMYQTVHFPPLSIEPEFGIPQNLETIIMRCLAKDPGERFNDVSALLTALNQLEYSEDCANRPLALAAGVISIQTGSPFTAPWLRQFENLINSLGWQVPRLANIAGQYMLTNTIGNLFIAGVMIAVAVGTVTTLTVRELLRPELAHIAQKPRVTENIFTPQATATEIPENRKSPQETAIPATQTLHSRKSISSSKEPVASKGKPSSQEQKKHQPRPAPPKKSGQPSWNKPHSPYTTGNHQGPNHGQGSQHNQGSNPGHGSPHNQGPQHNQGYKAH